MSDDPHSPVVLARLPNEISAAALRTALASFDIEAHLTGGFVSGFKAEAPGNVQIVVARADFDRARAALLEIQSQPEDIDWSQIDLGEPDE